MNDDIPPGLVRAILGGMKTCDPDFASTITEYMRHLDDKTEFPYELAVVSKYYRDKKPDQEMIEALDYLPDLLCIVSAMTKIMTKVEGIAHGDPIERIH